LSRCVGIDLHRRRSVVVILDPDGTRVSSTRIENSPMALAAAVADPGPEPEVVLEATWGWYWAADVIKEAGGRVHLAHPQGVKGFDTWRVKNDDRDATLLADLLRNEGSLPESWIAPRSLSQLREPVRFCECTEEGGRRIELAADEDIRSVVGQHVADERLSPRGPGRTRSGRRSPARRTRSR